jgi:creatinine amidohydrolase
MEMSAGTDTPRTPRRWSELTAPTLRAIFADDPATVALLPVGATEQHGPHLPTGTDTILAVALCDEVSARTGALVLPALATGASWWHGTGLGGTLALAGEELAALAVTTAVWAAHSGVRRLLFVNGHVGNTAPLAVACDRLRFEHRDLRVGIVEWWNLTPAINAEATADAADWHANQAETALMLAVRPDLVNRTAAAGADDPDRTTGLVFRYPAAQVSRHGVTGSPSKATAATGRLLWDRVIAAAVDVVWRARVEQPPLG